jgi:hypothetical protein
MAYRLTYWKYSYGPNRPDDLEEVIPARRIRNVKEMHLIMRPIPRECDVITLDRTDKQSPVSREVWKRNAKQTSH